MELTDLLRSRRMTRHFLPRPIDHPTLTEIFSDGLFAPSAGYSQGAEFLILTGEAERDRFWNLVADPEWRERSRIAAGVVCAPVVALCLADPTVYAERYGRADKAGSALGGLDPETWAVPYPLVDAAFATMVVLLSAEKAGVGALFFHLQGRERAVLDGLGVPERFGTIGALALGFADPDAHRSAGRAPRVPRASRIHFDRIEDTP